jgi:hypothetical protein
MAHTEFVEVYRVEHGDYMFIPKEVQEKYQDKFVLKVEVEEEVAEEATEVKPKRGRRAK